jgi:ribosomal protein S18 acetylase RimI-like enzyme
MEVLIRALGRADAAAVGALYQQSAAHLRSLGDDTDFQFDAHAYLRDGFGPRPAFSGIGAFLDGQLAGYLIYAFGYETDRAIRQLYVLDLIVDERVRRQGIGRRLMHYAATLCRDAGGGELFWGVFERNELAIAFYRRLGATEVGGSRFMHLPV